MSGNVRQCRAMSVFVSKCPDKYEFEFVLVSMAKIQHWKCEVKFFEDYFSRIFVDVSKAKTYVDKIVFIRNVVFHLIAMIRKQSLCIYTVFACRLNVFLSVHKFVDHKYVNRYANSLHKFHRYLSSWFTMHPCEPSSFKEGSPSFTSAEVWNLWNLVNVLKFHTGTMYIKQLWFGETCEGCLHTFFIFSAFSMELENVRGF